MERDEDLAPARAGDDEERRTARLLDGRDAAHGPAVLGLDRAPDEVVVIQSALFGRPQGVLGNEDLEPGQFIGPGQPVDALELEEMGILVRADPLDLELPRPPPLAQKNFKKKPSGTSSENRVTLSSPSRPWLRSTFPTARSSGLFNDLQIVAPLELHARGAEDDADGPGRPALLADHLAQVFRSHS